MGGKIPSSTREVDIPYPPVFSYLDFSKDFILHDDTSKDGFICAIYQQQQDQLRLIGYRNKTLVGAEKLKIIDNIVYRKVWKTYNYYYYQNCTGRYTKNCLVL